MKQYTVTVNTINGSVTATVLAHSRHEAYLILRNNVRGF